VVQSPYYPDWKASVGKYQCEQKERSRNADASEKRAMSSASHLSPQQASQLSSQQAIFRLCEPCLGSSSRIHSVACLLHLQLRTNALHALPETTWASCSGYPASQRCPHKLSVSHCESKHMWLLLPVLRITATCAAAGAKISLRG